MSNIVRYERLAYFIGNDNIYHLLKISIKPVSLYFDKHNLPPIKPRLQLLLQNRQNNIYVQL